MIPCAAAEMIAYRVSTPRLVVELEKVVRLARRGSARCGSRCSSCSRAKTTGFRRRAHPRRSRKIGSTDKTLHWTTGNGHVVTVDYGHEAIEAFVADWLDSRLP